MRIACLGSSFDPIHLGYLKMAEALRLSGYADQVWLVVAYKRPPWKEPAASFEHRFSMCRLVENPDSGIFASSVECELFENPTFIECQQTRGQAFTLPIEYTYTFYVLRYLRKTRPKHQFFWAVDSDILLNRDYLNWHRWPDLKAELIEDNTGILVTERPGFSLPDTNLATPFIFAGRVPIAVSSMYVRELTREGKDIVPYAGDEIAAYIKLHGLYQKR